MDALIRLIIILGTFSKINTEGIKFEKIEDSPGIIFSDLGDVQLTYKTWKICYFYDLNNFLTETAKLQQYAAELDNICIDKIANVKDTEPEICKLTIENYKKNFQDFEEKEGILNSYQTISSRKKRAPLEIVGTLGHVLFGLLDSEDAKFYNEEIDKIRLVNQNQANLLEKQTIIVESILRLGNKTNTEIKKLNKELARTIGSVKTQANLLQWKTQFNTLATTVILAFLQQETQMDKIINLLSHTLKGEVTSFISLDQLHSNLKIIKESLRTEEELPINISKDNLYNLFKTSSIHSILRDNRLLVELTIPILSTTIFKLLKTIPIPIHNSNQFFIIEPSSNMFLTNVVRNQYIPLTELEFKDCRSLSNNRSICKQNEPIIYGEVNNCELTILNYPHL